MSENFENIPSGGVSAEEEFFNDLESVLKRPEGKRVLWKILERAGLYASSYSGENAAATNFRLGEQNIGLWLVSQIESVDQTAYAMMILEMARSADLDKGTVDVVEVDEE